MNSGIKVSQRLYWLLLLMRKNGWKRETERQRQRQMQEEEGEREESRQFALPTDSTPSAEVQ